MHSIEDDLAENLLLVLSELFQPMMSVLWCFKQMIKM